jgi:hypothetical protein
MVGNIHLGARADHNADRHFLGDMAGVMISQEDLTPEQVSCIFTASEEFLPAQLVECSEPPPSMLALSFLGSSADLSGNDVGGQAGRLGSCEAQAYTIEDWVVWTAAGHDILEMTGTVEQCRRACCGEVANDGLINNQPIAGQAGHDKECIAFSRAKDASEDDATASCWLKAFTPEVDRSAQNAVYHSYTRRRVALGGEAQVTSSGAQFDTDRDYITVLDFDYETGDGTFTVSFWMTKEECTDSVYEYLYSHMSSTSAATMWSTSSLNIYLGCEEANGGFSTLAGGQGATSIMRYNIYDVTGKTAMFDYALHEAGDFDAITNVWVHTVFTVTRTALVTYDDGMRVNDIGCNVQTAGDGTTACPYGFYSTGVGPSSSDSGVALPRPGALSQGGFGEFDFAMDLFLGASEH